MEGKFHEYIIQKYEGSFKLLPNQNITNPKEND